MYIDIKGSASAYYNFETQEHFDGWKEGAAPARGSASGTGTVAVRFGPEFAIKPVHIKAVADAFNSRLISLYLGDPDTGNGVSVTDAAVRHLASRCPALRKLALCSCTGVSDGAFHAVVASLPKLEVLHCTGHDRSSGKLTGKALDPLLKSKAALKCLKQLYLTDQSGVSFTKMESLVKKRRALYLQTGDTGKWGGGICELGAGSFGVSSFGFGYGGW